MPLSIEKMQNAFTQWHPNIQPPLQLITWLAEDTPDNRTALNTFFDALSREQKIDFVKLAWKLSHDDFNALANMAGVYINRDALLSPKGRVAPLIDLPRWQTNRTEDNPLGLIHCLVAELLLQRCFALTLLSDGKLSGALANDDLAQAWVALCRPVNNEFVVYPVSRADKEPARIIDVVAMDVGNITSKVLTFCQDHQALACELAGIHADSDLDKRQALQEFWLKLVNGEVPRERTFNFLARALRQPMYCVQETGDCQAFTNDKFDAEPLFFYQSVDGTYSRLAPTRHVARQATTEAIVRLLEQHQTYYTPMCAYIGERLQQVNGYLQQGDINAPRRLWLARELYQRTGNSTHLLAQLHLTDSLVRELPRREFLRAVKTSLRDLDSVLLSVLLAPQGCYGPYAEAYRLKKASLWAAKQAEWCAKVTLNYVTHRQQHLLAWLTYRRNNPTEDVSLVQFAYQSLLFNEHVGIDVPINNSGVTTLFWTGHSPVINFLVQRELSDIREYIGGRLPEEQQVAFLKEMEAQLRNALLTTHDKLTVALTAHNKRGSPKPLRDAMNTFVNTKTAAFNRCCQQTQRRAGEFQVVTKEITAYNHTVLNAYLKRLGAARATMNPDDLPAGYNHEAYCRSFIRTIESQCHQLSWNTAELLLQMDANGKIVRGDILTERDDIPGAHPVSPLEWFLLYHIQRHAYPLDSRDDITGPLPIELASTHSDLSTALTHLLSLAALLKQMGASLQTKTTALVEEPHAPQIAIYSPLKLVLPEELLVPLQRPRQQLLRRVVPSYGDSHGYELPIYEVAQSLLNESAQGRDVIQHALRCHDFRFLEQILVLFGENLPKSYLLASSSGGHNGIEPLVDKDHYGWTVLHKAIFVGYMPFCHRILTLVPTMLGVRDTTHQKPPGGLLVELYQALERQAIILNEDYGYYIATPACSVAYIKSLCDGKQGNNQRQQLGKGFYLYHNNGTVWLLIIGEHATGTNLRLTPLDTNHILDTIVWPNVTGNRQFVPLDCSPDLVQLMMKAYHPIHPTLEEARYCYLNLLTHMAIRLSDERYPLDMLDTSGYYRQMQGGITEIKGGFDVERQRIINECEMISPKTKDSHYHWLRRIFQSDRVKTKKKAAGKNLKQQQAALAEVERLWKLWCGQLNEATRKSLVGADDFWLYNDSDLLISSQQGNIPAYIQSGCDILVTTNAALEEGNILGQGPQLDGWQKQRKKEKELQSKEEALQRREQTIQDEEKTREQQRVDDRNELLEQLKELGNTTPTEDLNISQLSRLVGRLEILREMARDTKAVPSTTPPPQSPVPEPVTMTDDNDSSESTRSKPQTKKEGYKVDTLLGHSPKDNPKVSTTQQDKTNETKQEPMESDDESEDANSTVFN